MDAHSTTAERDFGSADADWASVVGEVHLTHVIDLDVQTSTGRPFGHDDVKTQIIGFALSSVFPYLRADLQRTAVSIGLPPVTLDAPPAPYGVPQLPEGGIVELSSEQTPPGASADGETVTAEGVTHDENAVIASEWGPLRASINAMVSKAAGLPASELPDRGSVLAVDTRAVAPLDFAADVWKGVRTSIAHLEAAAQLICDGDPIEEGPCFALFRASIEVSATMHWLLSPDDRSQSIERYLTWRVRDLTDCAAARKNLGIDDGFLAEGIEQILNIASKYPRASLATIKKGRVESTSIIKSANSIPVPTWSILYAWQLSSAHAHGRPWADTRFGVMPLDSGPAMITALTSIRARTYTFALAAFRLCDEVLKLFVERATVESSSGRYMSDPNMGA